MGMQFAIQDVSNGNGGRQVAEHTAQGFRGGDANEAFHGGIDGGDPLGRVDGENGLLQMAQDGVELFVARAFDMGDTGDLDRVRYRLAYGGLAVRDDADQSALLGKVRDYAGPDDHAEPFRDETPETVPGVIERLVGSLRKLELEQVPGRFQFQDRLAICNDADAFGKLSRFHEGEEDVVAGDLDRDDGERKGRPQDRGVRSRADDDVCRLVPLQVLPHRDRVVENLFDHGDVGLVLVFRHDGMDEAA
jgi:hypothetical protein